MAVTISGLFSACPAFSAIVHIEGYGKLCDHPRIQKFMKGIYNKHLTLPRYGNTQQTFVGLEDVLKTSSKRLQRNTFSSFRTS